MSSSQEYNGTSTSARACYSNIKNYASNGMSNPIIAPVPATMQPTLYKLMGANSLPKSMFPKIGKVPCCNVYKSTNY